MDIEKEYEKKYKITKDEYIEINNKLSDKVYEENHTDTYFDTDNRYYKRNNSILRIRKTNGEYILTHKVKNNDGSSTEFHEQKKSDELFEFFNKKINIIAKIEVHRIRYKFKNTFFDLDKTIFLNKYEDYELEIEANNFEDIDNLNLKYDNSKPKIARYFEAVERFKNEFFEDKLLIVEGRSDIARLKKIYSKINIISTSGLGIDDTKIYEINNLIKHQKLQPVVLTDADSAGEKIRKIINDNVENCLNAYVPKNVSISKNGKKIGVEHSNEYSIIESLLNFKTSTLKNQQEEYKTCDMIDWGLYSSKKARYIFCSKLHISYGNNKKVLKQINNYKITKEKIKKVLGELEDDK